MVVATQIWVETKLNDSCSACAHYIHPPVTGHSGLLPIKVEKLAKLFIQAVTFGKEKQDIDADKKQLIMIHNGRTGRLGARVEMPRERIGS